MNILKTDMNVVKLSNNRSRVFEYVLKILCLTAIFAAAAFAQALPERPVPKAKFLIKTVGGNDDKGKDTFRVGEKILIKTLLKNESNEPLQMVAVNPFWQYRVMLVKLGKPGPVPFRSDRARLLSYTENDWGAGAVLWRPPLEPGRSKELMTLDLNEIFDPLEPGRYKLTVFYRTGVGRYSRTKLPSSKLDFEIVP